MTALAYLPFIVGALAATAAIVSACRGILDFLDSIDKEI